MLVGPSSNLGAASLAVIACNLTAMTCYRRRATQSPDLIDPCVIRRELLHLARHFAQEADQLAADEVARLRMPPT